MKLTTKVEQLSELILWYEEQFRLKREKEFGPSSELTDFNQLSFFNEVEDEDVLCYGVPHFVDLIEIYPKKK